VRRNRASWFAPSHATDQENPNQEGTLQAKRDAVVLMSASVPRRGQPVAVRYAAADQDGAGRRSVGRWIWTTMLTSTRPRRHVRALASARRRRSGRQPVGGTIRVWTTTDQRNTSCMMPSRATREGRDVSQQCQPAGRAQINPICAAAPINRSALARLQNGGSCTSTAQRLVTERDSVIRSHARQLTLGVLAASAQGRRARNQACVSVMLLAAGRRSLWPVRRSR
jgi:hypothetical protein